MRSLHWALAVALLVAVHPPEVAADDECTGVADGVLCSDDRDPCTTDVCVAATCRHDDVPNRTTCEPLLDAYRRTLGLTVLAVETAALAVTIGIPEAPRLVITAALGNAEVTLTRASDALAGRLAVPPPATGETLAQARSRAAFGIVRTTPPAVRPGLKAARGGDVQAVSPALADRMRFLYRGLNLLKRELRRLQRVSGVLAR